MAAQSALCKEITTDLKSTATSSASTFSALQALLGFHIKTVATDAESSSTKEQDAAVMRKKKSPNGSTKDSTIPRARTKATLEIKANNACHSKPLDAKARRKLATDAFNIALKCLGDAVKARQERQQASPICKPKPSRQIPRTKPLQPSSPNKPPNPATKDCTKSSTSNLSDNVSIVADCAIVAQDYLQDSNPQEEQDNRQNSLRLERGALILLERLISLQLNPQALVQASRLYEQYWKRRKDSVEKHNATSNSTTQMSQSALPIAFQIATAFNADFEFVSSFQSQILRLAIVLGPQAITNTFVKDIRLSIPGSPADVVLKGFEEGTLSQEKAGQRLRTIAQALLKLYSTVDSSKQRRTADSNLRFTLLTDALLIKCKSWILLEHQPDLQNEFWAFFSKGLKRLPAEDGPASSDFFETSSALVHSAEECLQRHDLNHAIPADIVNIVLDLAENGSFHSKGLSFLRDCTYSSQTWTQEQQIYFHWRTATLQYRCSEPNSEQVLVAFKVASRTVEGLTSIGVQRADDMLLYGARLRKTVLSAFRDCRQARSDTETIQSNDEITSHCISILSDLLIAYSRLLQIINAKDNLSTLRLGYNSFAKTCEALLEICKDGNERFVWWRKLVDERLGQCVKILKSTISMTSFVHADTDCQTTAFVERLLAKASNIYWSRYSQQTDENTEKPNILDALHMSCVCLEDLDPMLQHSASYGARLEKLALLRLKRKDTFGACETFQKAVEHYIGVGALKEAASASMSGSSCNVWAGPRTKSRGLYHALQSMTRLRLTYGIGHILPTDWIYDVLDAPIVERILIFEIQTQAGTDHDFSQAQVEFYQKHLHMLIDKCDDPCLHVHRLRFMSKVLQMSSKTLTLSDVFSSTTGVFKEEFEHQKPPSVDGLLSTYAESLHLTVRLQYWMQPGSFDVEQIRVCSQLLSTFILNITEKERLRLSIDDLNLLVNQLQAVSDLGRMLDDIDLMLVATSSLKHILTMTDLNDASKKVDVFTQLAVLYHRLGNTEHADETFAAAELLAHEIPAASVSHSRWALSYVGYLADSLDMDKAIRLYSGVGENLEVQKTLEASSGHQRLEIQVLTTMAAQAASRLAFIAGDLRLAIRFTRQSVRLSSEIWRAIEDRDCRVDAQGCFPRRVKGAAYWSVAQLHRASLRNAISLSMHNGMQQDTVYYVEQLRKLTPNSDGSHNPPSEGLQELICLFSTMST